MESDNDINGILTKLSGTREEEILQAMKENGEYHCTIYGGRPFICRFFGAYGAKSKTGERIFKPCKFYPAEILSSHKPPLAHRQYREGKMREVLPKSIKRIKWICSMAAGN